MMNSNWKLQFNLVNQITLSIRNRFHCITVNDQEIIEKQALTN